jgi:hypothetical protein
MAIYVFFFMASLLATLGPPENKNTPPPQAPVVITLGPGYIPSTPIAAEKPTSLPDPRHTPFVPEINVLKWNIKHICQARKVIRVEIVGAEITGGISPYWIEAHDEDGTVIPRESTISPDPLSPNKVVLKSPIRVLPDKWITVSIKSTSLDQIPEWTGRWYFPSNDPNCQRSRE